MKAQLFIVSAIILVSGMIMLATLSTLLPTVKLEEKSISLDYEELREKFGQTLNLAANNETIVGGAPLPYTKEKMLKAFNHTEKSFVIMESKRGYEFYGKFVDFSVNAAGNGACVNVTLYLTNLKDTVKETVMYVISSGTYLYYGNPSSFGGHDSTKVFGETLVTSIKSFDDTFTKDYDTTGLVAQWHMDEGKGNTIEDSSGNGNDGTYTVSALEFDGVDDYVEIPDKPWLDLPNEYTVELWCTPDTVPTTQTYLLSKEENYEIFLDKGMHISWRRTVRGSDVIVVGDIVLDIGKWYHVTISHSVSRGKGWLIINGDVDKEVAVTDPADTNDDIVKIGDNIAPPKRFFDGKIDEIRIYQRALLPVELKEHYHEIYNDDKGIVGRWHFSEGSGTTTADSSGFDNTGTLRNGPVWTTSIPPLPRWLGKDGGGWSSRSSSSLKFDGVDDYIEMPDSASLDIDAKITVELWVATTWAPPDYSAVPLTKGAYKGAYWIEYFPDAHYNFGLTTSGGDRSVSSTTALNDGLWHHIVGTYDGATQKIYVDGVLWASQDFVDSIKTTTNQLSIGKGGWTTTDGKHYYNGLIDGTRIYNRTLSATEVVEHSRGIFTDETGLCGLWKMKEGTGTLVVDDSGKLNNGVLTNGVAWSTDAPSLLKPDIGFKIGSAMPFNLTDTYAKIPDSTSLNIQDAVTVEAWIYPMIITSSRQTILSSKEASNAGFILGLEENSDNKLRFWVYTDSWEGVTGTSSLSKRWYHVAGTYDGSVIKVYVDGAEQNSADVSGKITQKSDTTAIGASNAVKNFFNGFIDEVRIYKRALSAGEIKCHAERRHYTSPEPTTNIGGEEKQQPGWWNTDWLYRIPINIDPNNNTNIPKKYQILCIVDTAKLIKDGKMRADCGDIRIVNSDGNLLYHWIEFGVNSASTRIWVLHNF